MAKIILHPGFHKTGTSSAQHLLWKNRGALLPHVEIFQIRHLKAPGGSALAFSKSGNPVDLIDLGPQLDAAFAGLGPKEGRHILISHEGLLGHLPGWPGVADYSAAGMLIPLYLEYLAERFPQHEREVVLTTRAPAAWLLSTWRHHLMGQRLREDFAAFSARIGPAAALADQARAVAEAVAPVPVVTADLAEAPALGPGAALLDRLGLPDRVLDGLTPVPVANRGPDSDLAEALLALNRSPAGDAEVAAEKAALIRRAGVGGWVR